MNTELIFELILIAMNTVYGMLKFGEIIIHIDKDRFSIGRGASNDLVVLHKSVANDHAVIELCENERLTLRDIGGSNGTFVNGFQLLGESIQLRAGDVITFGSYPVEHLFHYTNVDDSQLEIDSTVVLPITDKKISLVGEEVYQHGTINHSAPFDEREDKEKGNKNSLENEKKDKEIIAQLNEKIEVLLIENESLKKESILKLMPIEEKTPPREDYLFALKQFDKILLQLSLSEKSEEGISKTIDSLLASYQIHQNNIESTKEIVSTMQKDFNGEIASFNLVIAKYDKRLADIIHSLVSMQSNDDKSKENAVHFIHEQIDQLFTEKEHLMKINLNQKEQLTQLETQLKLLEVELSTEILQLKSQNELLQRNNAKVEQESQIIESSESLKSHNQLNATQKEEPKLSKQFNSYTEKYSSLGISGGTVESKAEIGDYNQIGLFVNHNNSRVRELIKKKDSIVALEKRSGQN